MLCVFVSRFTVGNRLRATTRIRDASPEWLVAADFPVKRLAAAIDGYPARTW
jgi:hypothetical protein